MLMDLIGEPFGDLTVDLLLEERDEVCKGRRWLCRCICGNTAIRTTHSLLEAKRRGQISCCRRCLVELNGGRFIEYAERRKEWFRKLWEETRTLYTLEELRKMEKEIRTAIEAEEGAFVGEDATKYAAVPTDEIYGVKKRRLRESSAPIMSRAERERRERRENIARLTQDIVSAATARAAAEAVRRADEYARNVESRRVRFYE